MHGNVFLRALLSVPVLVLLLVACGGPGGTGLPKPPSLASFAPAAAARGETVTVTGTDFGDEAGTLTIGGVTATVTDWTSTSVKATVPADAANGWNDVTVTTAGGSASRTNLFVGREFTGEADELQAFLDAQERGTAVLLEAATYEFDATISLYVYNLELYGRGMDETVLEFDPDFGSANILVDYGATAGLHALSVTGAGVVVLNGTLGHAASPLAAAGTLTSTLDLADSLRTMAAVGQLAPAASSILPTVELREVAIDAKVLFSVGVPPSIELSPAPLNLEIHDSKVDSPDMGTSAFTLGRIVMSGTDITASMALIVSVTHDVQVSDSSVTGRAMGIGGTGGVTITDTRLLANDGDINILGLLLADLNPDFPGGPITITGSSLRALDANLADGTDGGDINVLTTMAPIVLTDNPVIRAQGDLNVRSLTDMFGSGRVTIARNPDIHVGVFTTEDAVNYRAGNFHVGAGTPDALNSITLPSRVTFAENNLSVAGDLSFEMDCAAILSITDNGGVVGGKSISGYVSVVAGDGDITFTGNELEITAALEFELDGTEDDTLLVANNKITFTESGSELYVESLGSRKVVFEGNDLSLPGQITLEAEGDVTITGNTLAPSRGGPVISGAPGTQLVTVSNNLITHGEDAVFGLELGDIESVVVQNNQLTLVGTPAGDPFALSIYSWQDHDMSVSATGNTFTGYARAISVHDQDTNTVYDVTINDNVFDFPIGAPGTAALIHNVHQDIDARHNTWGDLTDAAAVAAAVSRTGTTTGNVLVNPIAD